MDKSRRQTSLFVDEILAGHLSDDDLLGLLTGVDLNARDRELLGEHVAHCERCKQRQTALEQEMRESEFLWNSDADTVAAYLSAYADLERIRSAVGASLQRLRGTSPESQPARAAAAPGRLRTESHPQKPLWDRMRTGLSAKQSEQRAATHADRWYERLTRYRPRYHVPLPQPALALAAASSNHNEPQPSRLLHEVYKSDDQAIRVTIRSLAPTTLRLAAETDRSELAGRSVRYALVNSAGQALAEGVVSLNASSRRKGLWVGAEPISLDHVEPCELVFEVMP